MGEVGRGCSSPGLKSRLGSQESPDGLTDALSRVYPPLVHEAAFLNSLSISLLCRHLGDEFRLIDYETLMVSFTDQFQRIPGFDPETSYRSSTTLSSARALS